MFDLNLENNNKEGCELRKPGGAKVIKIRSKKDGGSERERETITRR